MIDTDKYEGHTPVEEWGDIVHADGYLSIFLDDDVYATDTDRQLMADAPLLLAEVKRLREVVDKQQMQYVNLETAYHNSPSQIEIQHEIDTAVEYRTENIKKYMKEKNKQLHAEVKRLREAIEYDDLKKLQKMYASSMEERRLLREEVKRFREITDYVKESIDYHYHCIDNMTGGFINWMEFARELHDMFYGDEEE